MTQKKQPKPVEAVLMPEKPAVESQAMIVRPHESIALAGDPKKILADAHIAAKALMEVVDSKPGGPLMMGGSKYLQVEDWQTLARFMNLVPKVRTDAMIRIEVSAGNWILGYEAWADLINIDTQVVISSAASMCLNDEEKWSSRAKYEFLNIGRDGKYYRRNETPASNLIWEERNGKSVPKSERVLTGETKVPLFQLRSMAQTRACAKACRNALAWIAVLAGFKPTPAEELDGEAEVFNAKAPEPDYGPYIDRNEPTVNKPAAKKAAAKAKAEPKPETPPPPPPPPVAPPPPPPPPVAPPPEPPAPPAKPLKTLTVGQAKRFWVIARTNEWNEEQIHTLLLREFKVDHTKDIPQGKQHYDRVVDTILTKGPAAYFNGGAQ